VLIVAHTGKDPTKGIRGNSGFMGNADVLLELTAHASGALKLHVKKMRDTASGFNVYFQVPPKGSTIVPVPERITEAEYKRLIGRGSGSKDDGDSDPFLRRERFLHEHGLKGVWGSGLTHDQFAAALVGPLAEGVDEAEWRAKIARERRSLYDASKKSNRRYPGVLGDRRGTEWRWFIVKPVQD
jgi:hypothetical protein